jgi:hypothetical protein
MEGQTTFSIGNARAFLVRGTGDALRMQGRGFSMKKLALAMAAAAVVVLSAVATSAAAAPGPTAMPAEKAPNNGADVYGTGGGKVAAGVQQFAFTAHEGPNGDFGHANVTTTDTLGTVLLSYSADVDCVNVVPAGDLGSPFDNVVFSGEITKVSGVNAGGLVVGDPVTFAAADGGNPSGAAPVDNFIDLPGTSLFGTCKIYYYPVSIGNVTQGNVNIKAGAPPF